MNQVELTAINHAERGEFIDLLGDIYEESPWVANQCVAERPFASVAELRETMRRTVEDATHDEQLALLRAHPDLGEQTEMTDASESEQAAAGLDELGPEQYETFQRLNDRYREQFGFPFIMAVKNETPDTIQAAMERRVDHSEEAEFQAAMDEVHKIAELRLDEMVAEAG
jgi:2-oxo-4-hydroxy-4-carboxy-5-ureidoimidazoline decarboxylase